MDGSQEDEAGSQEDEAGSQVDEAVSHSESEPDIAEAEAVIPDQCRGVDDMYEIYCNARDISDTVSENLPSVANGKHRFFSESLGRNRQPCRIPSSFEASRNSDIQTINRHSFLIG